MFAVLATSFEAHVRSGVWRKRAACLGYHPIAFYPSESADTAYDQVRPICEACPVRLECDQYAFMMNEQNGMWAGRTERGRRQARKKWVETFIVAKALPPVIERRSATGQGDERSTQVDVGSSVRIQVALHLLGPFAVSPIISLMGIDDPTGFVAHLSNANPIPEVIKVIDQLFTDGLLDNQIQNDRIALTTLGARFLQSHEVKVAHAVKQAAPIAPSGPRLNQTQLNPTKPVQPIRPRRTVMSDYLLEFLAQQPKGRFNDENGKVYEAIAKLLHRTKGSVSQRAAILRGKGFIESDGARGAGTFAISLTHAGWAELGETTLPPDVGSEQANVTAHSPSGEIDLTDIHAAVSERVESFLAIGVDASAALQNWLESLRDAVLHEYREAVSVAVGRLQEQIDHRLTEAEARAATAEARAQAAEDEAAKAKRQALALLSIEGDDDGTAD